MSQWPYSAHFHFGCGRGLTMMSYDWLVFLLVFECWDVWFVGLDKLGWEVSLVNFFSALNTASLHKKTRKSINPFNELVNMKMQAKAALSGKIADNNPKIHNNPKAKKILTLRIIFSWWAFLTPRDWKARMLNLMTTNIYVTKLATNIQVRGIRK